MNKKIAAIVTSYNEEQRIGYTLESLQMFDAIIVQDKGSEDNTVAVAKEHGAKVYTLPLTDDMTHPEYVKVWNQCMQETDCDWILMLTCSDILHPDLYRMMKDYIENNDVDMVELPFYRYSMGFVSKYSFYHDLHYKNLLLKKEAYVVDANIHVMVKESEHNKIGRVTSDDKQVAIYHLTHESLDIIMERHLRYAQVEASMYPSREEGLKSSWRDLLRQAYLYVKLKTYKLGEAGKAQLCMLILYRAAKYLNTYFDKEKEAEIKKIYDDIRQTKKDVNK